MTRKMKDSGIEWIGKIPEEWKILRNKQLFFETNEKSGDNEYELLSVSEYYGVGLKKEKILENDIISRAEKLDDYKVCDVNDLVINIMLAWKRGLGVSDYKGIVSPAYGVYRKKSEEINSKYYHYLFRTDNCALNFKQYSTGIIDSRLRLYSDKFFSLYSPLPSLKDQDYIVKYLDKKCILIDIIIEKEKHVIEKLKEYKQSIITEAVTKGINHSVELKSTGYFWVGDVPKVWTVGKLKYFATIRSGLTLGKKYSVDTRLVEYPYLRVANVQGDHTDLRDVATILIPESEAQKYKLQAGEVLMTEGGDRDKLGRGCVWHGEINECLHQNHVFAVKTDIKRLNSQYFDYVTTSDIARTYFDFTAKKTTNLASTNSTTILEFSFPIPPIDEQYSIIKYLDNKCSKINSVINQKEKLIEKLTEYKKSLIYECVTGKREV